MVSANQVLAPTVQILVFPDLLTADGDTLNLGAGSLYFAEVTLTRTISAKGGLSKNDFVLEPAVQGIITARAFEPGVAIIPVPDAGSAVVRVISHPARIVEVSEDTEAEQADVAAEPAITMMWAPRPNPAVSAVTFHFRVSRRLPARLVVYDVQGRRVATLIDGLLEPGPHNYTWDRSGARGNRAKSGIYFARFEADGLRFTQRFVMVQ